MLGGEDADIAEAVAVAREADVCVVALGDLAGLFGRGTSGEGCDAVDLRLPGRQEELLEAVLATGTPVVLVLLVGRPYDISAQTDRLAGVVCGFFPGEEGATAIVDVLAGRAEPAGRLPVSFPGAGSSQPSTYLAAPLSGRNEVTNIDPTPLFGFGHGLTYTSVAWTDAGAVVRSGVADRRVLRDRGPGGEHRRPHGVRGGAGLPPRPGGRGGPPGPAADRRGPRRPGPRRSTGR